MHSREDEAKQLIRAQRLAKRSRASAACLPCKAKKARCNDYRPCARCQRSPGEVCIDDNPEITSSMYHALMMRASSASSNQGSMPVRRSFHAAIVPDSSQNGNSDAFASFASTFGYHVNGSTWARAFATTLTSPVCDCTAQSYFKGQASEASD
jgi:hypothetical protein